MRIEITQPPDSRGISQKRGELRIGLAAAMSKPETTSQVVKINQFRYIHVKNKNTNSIRLITGPLTYTTEEYEEVTKQPAKMILVPPEHFVVVANPAVKEKDKLVCPE